MAQRQSKQLRAFSFLLIVVFLFLSASLAISAASIPTAGSEKYQNLKLTVGGVPFGVKFMTEGVLIVGMSEVPTKDGKKNPAYEAGLRVGDRIVKLGGQTILGASELAEIVSKNGAKPMSVVYVRAGKEQTAKLTPVYSTSEARYVTGIYVRDGGAGIGTLTFIVPKTGAFAGLGHGICDASTGKPIPMQRGSVVDVTISGVVRGLSGSPGEVKGYFSSGKTGTLLGNTECGVYGVLAKLPKNLSEPIPVGLRNEVSEGKAKLLCTLDDGVRREYGIEISEIQRDATGNKCFSVKVTDPALLSKTGGIIQGMSGSPIIQNGKLIGAVTHVLISDPTTGYGIFIENMLDQMGDLVG